VTYKLVGKLIRQVAVLCLVIGCLPGVALGQAVPGAGDMGVTLGPNGVLVLPFANISGESRDDWIGVGIAETVSADLARLGVAVAVGEASGPGAELGRQDQFGLARDQAAGAVAREAGATWFVSGGFQRVAEELRIIARVVRVDSGEVQRTVTLDGRAEELFALQDGIARDISSVFVLNPDGDGRRATVDDAPPSVPSRSAIETTEGLRGGDGQQARRPTDRELAPPSTRHLGADGAGAVSGFRGAGTSAGMTATGPEFGVLAGRPLIQPTRTEVRPTIDGRLDDEVWQTAATITDFVQQSPLDGAGATEATEVRLAYDSQNIYLAFHAHYVERGLMRANRVDRDQAAQDDLITVYFDPFFDQQRSYVFDVNGYGVQGDGIINSRGGSRGGGRGRRGGPRGGSSGPNAIPNPDRSWDALFESAAQIVADGFTAEIAIPFKSLRYPQLDETTPHRWGFQVSRSIRSKDNEVDVWSPMSRDEFGFMTQMGVLGGMTNLSTSRNLEFLPTFTGIHFGSRDRTTGAFPEEVQGEGGLDMKYGITSNLTFDFTFNPDFSQIESDVAQIDVNQRFPLFFPELRPFFLEGQEIFQFTSPHQWVNTRTIVDPKFGAKLTGKVGDLTLGLLAADDEAPGNLDDRTDPAYGQSAQVFIGRARYDLYAQSHLGATVTDREFMDGYSRAVGVDGQFRLGQAARFNLMAFQTMNRDLDGHETSGTSWGTFFQRNGRTWRVASFMGSDDPDAATDLGFIRRTNSIRSFSNASYRWWPEGWVINWGPRIRYQRLYDHESILEDETIDTGVDFTFARSISAGAGVQRQLERFAGINYWKTRFTSTANVATSRRISLGGNVSWGDQIFFDKVDPFLGRGTEVGLEVFLRPVARLQSQINIDTSRLMDLRTGDVEVFDIKLFRAFTTYQFTERLLLRNITEFNTFQNTVGVNLLATYRLNAGTVFFLGYDDRYRQQELFEEMGDELLLRRDLQRTNRAIFTKLQYLFRL